MQKKQDILGEKYLHRGGRCKEHFGVNARYSFSLLVGQQGKLGIGEISQKKQMKMNYSLFSIGSMELADFMKMNGWFFMVHVGKYAIQRNLWLQTPVLGSWSCVLVFFGCMFSNSMWCSGDSAHKKWCKDGRWMVWITTSSKLKLMWWDQPLTHKLIITNPNTETRREQTNNQASRSKLGRTKTSAPTQHKKGG